MTTDVRSIGRRAFLAGAGASLAAFSRAVGQRPGGRAGMTHDSSLVRDTTNLFAMDQGAERPVSLPRKPNAVTRLTNEQRDALEHQLHCQCGCTLDVYTCRTTDFSCQVSPAMHRDVMGLVEGGYSAQEIIDAFVSTYGEQVLMAPRRRGFDLLAWVTPGAAVVVAGAVILGMLRRWRTPPPAVAGPRPANVDATDEELARIEAAVRGDDR